MTTTRQPLPTTLTEADLLRMWRKSIMRGSVIRLDPRLLRAIEAAHPETASVLQQMERIAEAHAEATNRAGEARAALLDYASQRGEELARAAIEGGRPPEDRRVELEANLRDAQLTAQSLVSAFSDLVHEEGAAAIIGATGPVYAIAEAEAMELTREALTAIQKAVAAAEALRGPVRLMQWAQNPASFGGGHQIAVEAELEGAAEQLRRFVDGGEQLP